MIGFAKGNFMNFGTAVAIYAAVQRELGSNELVFPGAEDLYTWVTMFSDARLHGHFCRWAALDRASWAFAGFAWGRDYDFVLSMSRARQLGWTGYVDSWDGFETVFRGLADAKVIPKQKW